MNEKTFKPLFLKTVEWGSVAGAEGRLLFLFKLTNSLLDHLKSIFVPYYSYIFDTAVSVLVNAKSSNIDNLWRVVLYSLIFKQYFFYQFFN